MKTINFIGYGDKTELMLYVAKIVREMNFKVLYIDSITTQKCRYIIPTIEYGEEYITSFEGIDVAIGFESHGAIIGYLNEHGEDFNLYDYIFIDLDSKEMCDTFNVGNANASFVVTSFDKMQIFKTIALIEKIQNDSEEYIKDIVFNRIYYYTMLNTSDEKYINYTFENKLTVNWNKNKMYIPLDEGDSTVLIQNQYAEKIKMKDLSSNYKKGITSIASIILPEENKNQVTKVLKNVERSV